MKRYLLLTGLTAFATAVFGGDSAVQWHFRAAHGKHDFVQTQTADTLTMRHDTDNGFSAFVAPLQLEPGAYRARVEVRTDGNVAIGGGAWIELQFPERQEWPPTQHGGRSLPAVTGGEWQVIRQTVRVPEWGGDTQKITLNLRNFNGGVEFRNFRLDRQPEASPHIVFSDCEAGAWEAELNVLPGRRYRVDHPMELTFADAAGNTVQAFELRADDTFRAPERFEQARLAAVNPEGRWITVRLDADAPENFDWRYWNSYTMIAPAGPGSCVRDFTLEELPVWAVGGFCTWGEIVINGVSLGGGDALPAHGGRRYVDLAPHLKTGDNRIEVRFPDGPREAHFLNIDIELKFADGGSRILLSDDGNWRCEPSGDAPEFQDSPDHWFVNYDKPWVAAAALPAELFPTVPAQAALLLEQATVKRGEAIAGTLELIPEAPDFAPEKRFAIEFVAPDGTIGWRQWVFPGEGTEIPLALATDCVPPGEWELRLDRRFAIGDGNRLGQVKIEAAELAKPDIAIDLTGGRPVIAVGGERIPAVLFNARQYANSKHYGRYGEQDYRDMRDSGIRFFCSSTELGSDMEKDSSSDLGSIWTGPGEYDFSGMDADIRNILASVPDGYVLLLLRCDDPKWRKTASPEEMIVLDDGTLHHSVSMASDRWADETCEAIRATFAWLLAQPYGHRIVGCYLIAGYDGQWLIYNDYSRIPPRLSDYSDIMQQAFARWQREKYPERTEPFAIPSREMRLDESVYFPEPEANRARLDYYNFIADLTGRRVKQFCDAVKEASNGRLAVGSYFTPNHGEASRWGQEQRQEDDTMWTADSFNFAALPHAYENRNLDNAGVVQYGLEQSNRIHGKLRIFEDDNRTFQLDGYRNLLFGNYTVQSTVASMRRNMALRLSLGQGHWYYDMYGHWFAPPVLRDIIRQELKLMRAADGFPTLPKLDAQAVDILGQRVQNHKRTNTGEDILHLYWHVRDDVWAYPVDTLFLRDIGHAKLPEYKLYFFQNLFALTDAERAKIESLKQDGNVLVFTHGTGYSDGRSWSPDHIEALTGIRVRPSGAPEKFLDAAWDFAEGGHPLLRDVAGTNALGSFFMPRFEVDDPRATPLGYFRDGGAVAAAVREFPDYTSIYLAGGTPTVPFPPRFTAALARQAGVPVLTDGTPLVVRAGARFLSVYCPHTQAEATVHVPGGYAAYDVFADRRLTPAEAQSIPLRLKRGDTKLYFVGTPEEIDVFRQRLRDGGKEEK